MKKPEFLTEIAPVIHGKLGCLKLGFKMFCKGKRTTVEVDDAGYAFNYAGTARQENKFLVSYFEKAVKQGCYKSLNNASQSPV